MSKSIKTTSFVGLLLVNMLVISCIFSGQDEQEKKKDLLENLIKGEKALIESIKANLSPQRATEFEESLSEAKTKRTVEDWDQEIEKVKDLKERIESDQVERNDTINHADVIFMLKSLVPNLDGPDIEESKTNAILLDYLIVLCNLREQAKLEGKVRE